MDSATQSRLGLTAKLTTCIFPIDWANRDWQRRTSGSLPTVAGAASVAEHFFPGRRRRFCITSYLADSLPIASPASSASQFIASSAISATWLHPSIPPRLVRIRRILHASRGYPQAGEIRGGPSGGPHGPLRYPLPAETRRSFAFPRLSGVFSAARSTSRLSYARGNPFPGVGDPHCEVGLPKGLPFRNVCAYEDALFAQEASQAPLRRPVLPGCFRPW